MNKWVHLALKYPFGSLWAHFKASFCFRTWILLYGVEPAGVRKHCQKEALSKSCGTNSKPWKIEILGTSFGQCCDSRHHVNYMSLWTWLSVPELFSGVAASIAGFSVVARVQLAFPCLGLVGQRTVNLNMFLIFLNWMHDDAWNSCLPLRSVVDCHPKLI